MTNAVPQAVATENPAGHPPKTKQAMYPALHGVVSKSAIQKLDGEWRVVGKFCYAAPEARGTWGIFVCNPADMFHGLGQRKVRNILSTLREHWSSRAFRELTGEGWGKAQSRAETRYAGAHRAGGGGALRLVDEPRPVEVKKHDMAGWVPGCNVEKPTQTSDVGTGARCICE